MGVLMKPMDLAWSLLKADPLFRTYEGRGYPKSSQAMHPGIVSYLSRTIPNVRQKIQQTGRIASIPNPRMFGVATNVPKDYDKPMVDLMRREEDGRKMDTLHEYGGSSARPSGEMKEGVSVSNQRLKDMSTPDDVLNLLQIPGGAPTPQNFFQGTYEGGQDGNLALGKVTPQEYGQMSPRDSEAFEEVFSRFMEEQGRRGNPDNVQMLPGNVMQQM